MRVLIIQENGHHEDNRNYRECFCLQRGFKHHGVDADVWGKLHDNYETEPDWESYDLIFSIENWDWMPRLGSVQTKKYIWAIDAHCKGVEAYEHLAHVNNFDRVLHATPSFAQDKCWLPNCYDDTLIKPQDLTEALCDVGFCGNVNNRGQLIKRLSDRLSERFKFDEFVIGDAMVNAINSYKVHWNANIGLDINYRNFETMGCKTALLTSHNHYYQELEMKSGKNCLIYSNVNEMIAMAEYLVENDKVRNVLATKGYELVKKHHTYKNRAKQILEMIK